MMTAIDVGAVLARLTAIILVLSVVKDFDGLYQAAAYLKQGLFVDVLLWGESIARILLATLLWLLPRVTAAFVIPASIRQKPFGELNASGLEQAAFGFLGLYLIVWGITDLFYHLFIVVISTEIDSLDHTKAGIVATAIQLLLGGWLFFGKGSPYDSVRRLRRA